MLQQLSLLAAGAQPWHHNICTAHSQRFAYAATLAIYVYEVGLWYVDNVTMAYSVPSLHMQQGGLCKIFIHHD